MTSVHADASPAKKKKKGKEGKRRKERRKISVRRAMVT